MNYLAEYFLEIESGKAIVSESIRIVYTKLTHETQHSDIWVFDEAKGEHAINFIETFCKQSKGRWYGKPMELLLFQKAFIQVLFGFVDKQGLRRFQETLLLIARKNGKSTLLAGIGLYMLMADGEGGAEVYSIASKKDQARLVFTEAVNMISQSQLLLKRLKKRKSDLYFDGTKSKFAPLASDSNTLDGLNSHCVIIDELHAIKDIELYEVMKQSVSARQQPLTLMISTAGTVRENIFDQMYEYAKKVVKGIIVDDRFLPLLYELDSEEEWQDETMWEKANPALDGIKDRQKLCDLVDRSKQDRSFLRGLLCKDFNIRQNETNAWLAFNEINNEATFDLERVRDTYAIGGCDLSATTDLTCATLLIQIPNDDTVYVLQQYFIPEARLQKIDETSKKEAPYRKWAEQGLVTICAGEMVDYHQVTQWFVQMRNTLQINTLWVGYDRAFAGYWVDEMKNYGFSMMNIPQGAKTWTQPMKEMGAYFAEHKVNYNNNPILKWNLSNTATKSLNPDGIESIQPVKLGKNRRIDGTVSLLNAWVIFNNKYNEYRNLVNR